MKTTISIIKADIGAIGGHITPSQGVLQTVKNHIKEEGLAKKLISDYYVTHTGDDIAILTLHKWGVSHKKIHKLCLDAFLKATEVAKSQGLYGPGQDLLKKSFAGTVRGMGPAVAEMEIDERPSEPFLMFTADKTDPGAYSLPLYLAFVDPMNTPGLLLSPKINRGFKFVIMDVNYTKADRVIKLNTPEDLYSIAALLRDQERFVIESIWTRDGKEQVASVSTTRLHNVAGKYVGKDDPVMLVRTQKNFPATGEILAPYARHHYVGGGMRGSHNVPLMPVRENSTISFFDGPAVVGCLAFCLQKGKLTEPVDAFNQPFWDYIRNRAAQDTVDIRRQGFFGPAMLPYAELEYGGIVDILKTLEKKFIIRKKKK